MKLGLTDRFPGRWQLLVPFALASGGSFRTLALTGHTTTSIDILERFLDVRVRQERSARDDVLIAIHPRSGPPPCC
jgi:RNA 3'-terminal phosphate cyclase (ATP)